jgi:hypothetical protein
MSLTVNSWSLIAYEDDITNPIRTITNSDTFDPTKWTTIGERYCLEINLSYSGTVNVGDNVGISFIRSSTTGAETISTPLIDKLISGSSVTSSNLLNFFNYYEDLGNLIVQFFFLNVADYNDWFADIDALGLPDDLLDKNIINNTILFSNFLPSQYNQPKKFRIALKYDTDPIEYFNFDFAGKFYSQNFANALPDIDFISDSLIVNGQFKSEISSSDNTTVSMRFAMLNETTPGTPTDANLHIIRIDLSDVNEYLIAQSIHTDTFTPLGNNEWQANFVINSSNIADLNEYRMVYTVYDTANDYFNSFPIARRSDGTPPTKVNKFTHKWATPFDVTNGDDKQKIKTSVFSRVGSYLSFEGDVYASLNILNIGNFFRFVRIVDSDGVEWARWDVTTQRPSNIFSEIKFTPDIEFNLAYVHRVPLDWNNSNKSLKWEILFEFPHGQETWEFTADLIVDDKADEIVFNNLNGDPLTFVCDSDIPNVIIVESNNAGQTLNDEQYAVVNNGFGWWRCIDEPSDIAAVQSNSQPNTPFNWELLQFDDPYIFDVEKSNGTVTRFKFRLKDYVNAFGINAISNIPFAQIHYR